VYVFHGSFAFPQEAAERRAARGWWFANHTLPPKAVQEFQVALDHAHAPSLVRSLYGWALQSAGRP